MENEEKKWKIKINNTENNPIDEILERYKKYQLDFIDAATETNLANLREKSKIGKIVAKIKKQFIEEMKKAYPEEEYIENLLYINYSDTKDLRKAVEEEIELHDTNVKILISDIEDAKALLKIAETYDQKIEILKQYNILDKEGRINIYE